MDKFKYLYSLIIFLFLYETNYSQDHLVPADNVFSYHQEQLQYLGVFSKVMQIESFLPECLVIVHLSYNPSEWKLSIYDTNRFERKTPSYFINASISDSSGLLTRSLEHPDYRIKKLLKCKIKKYIKPLMTYEAKIIINTYEKMMCAAKISECYFGIGEPDEEFYHYNNLSANYNPWANGENTNILLKISSLLKQYACCEKDDEQYLMAKILDYCSRILNGSNKYNNLSKSSNISIDYYGLTYLGIVTLLSIVCLILISLINNRIVKKK